MKLQLTKIHKFPLLLFFRPTVLHDHAASRLVKKSLICLEGKAMTPHRGNTIFFRSSQQLPHHRHRPLSSHGTIRGPLKGAVSAQKALQLPVTRKLLGGMEENSVTLTRGQ